MILQNPFNLDDFTIYISNLLPNFKLDKRPVDVGSTGFKEILKLGYDDLLETTVFVIRIHSGISSRISLANNSFRILKNYSIFSALIVYINDDESLWRFSHLYTDYSIINGKVVSTFSNPKRHSYVLGTNTGIATARKYLEKLGKIKDFEDLKNRFSVEVVNKDFYNSIAQHFYKLVGINSQKGIDVTTGLLKLPIQNAENYDYQNYSVRLLGRIMFLWFLKQKKGPTGLSLLPDEILIIPDNQSNSFLNETLEPLFFEVLNKNVISRNSKFKNQMYSAVPYLNGGLFHPADGNSGDFYDSNSMCSVVSIPNIWFSELFKTLHTYNFTIDENLENDIELSIDPEMLGRVFENLLAEINPETGQVARKSTGSYYTPRSIVNFMVDESLICYFKEKTKIKEDALKALVSIDRHDDLLFPLTDNQKLEIVESIKKLKVLDPACGSGAFPIGVLQKLLWILSQTDHSGEDYLDAEDFTGTENWLTEQKLDYLRKRKLIRDVIYGSDIQSVAVEIAKLRCFLTMIVDQEIDENSPNRGVIPLPNLDFKFICADSLIPLDSGNQMAFGEDPELEKKLLKIRNKYFGTSDEVRKEKLKVEYDKLISEDLLSFSDSKRTKQLKSFHPFKNNSRAIFFDAKTMFGIENFDVIIGNPPYISALAAKKILPAELREEYKKTYDSAKGAYDMYLLFMEMGIRLLNKNGVLVFITPTKFLSAKYAESFRKFASNYLLKIVDFSNSRIFDSAGVSTAISFFQNSKSRRQVMSLVYNNRLDKPLSQTNFEIKSLQMFPEQTWGHLKWGDSTLLEKIYNDASSFEAKSIVVASSTASEADDWAHLISEDESATSFKMVNTGTLAKYFVLWGVSPYSNRKKRLLKPNLEVTSKDREVDTRRIEMFRSPKVIVAKLSKHLKAGIDYQGIFASSNTVFVYEPKNPYTVLTLGAVLNSKLIDYVYRSTFSGLNLLGSFQFQAPQIRILPLPEKPNTNLVEKIDNLTSKLLANTRSSMENIKLIEEIDLLVFELYGLEKSEIGIILDTNQVLLPENDEDTAIELEEE